jgi:hypothetical protein
VVGGCPNQASKALGDAHVSTLSERGLAEPEAGIAKSGKLFGSHLKVA